VKIIKILVAEDNKLFSGMLVLKLGKAITASMSEHPGELEAEFCVCESLSEALTKSVEWKPDVTLFDPTLTDAPDWRESLLAIKTGWHGLPPFHPPVWIISGMEKTPEVVKTCMDAGALDYFYKPWDMDFVERIVSDIATKLLIKSSESKRAPDGQ
jgi:hypothetical protein